MNLAKVAAGLILITVTYMIFPVLQALEVFVYFLLPIALLLVAVGLVSDGTYNMIKGAPSAIDDMKNRAGQYRESWTASAPAEPVQG